MKNWLDKMERRFGRYAIRNLTMYLLAGYAIGYLLSFTMTQLLTYFTLEPALILKGQVWRLLSWVIIPPNDNIIFVIFMMLLYYSLGNTLESYWGAFRYNVYIFSGILFTVILCILYYIAVKKMIKQGDRAALLCILMFACYGITEGFLSNIFRNFSLLFLANIICNDMPALIGKGIPVKLPLRTGRKMVQE